MFGCWVWPMPFQTAVGAFTKRTTSGLFITRKEVADLARQSSPAHSTQPTSICGSMYAIPELTAHLLVACREFGNTQWTAANAALSNTLTLQQVQELEAQQQAARENQIAAILPTSPGGGSSPITSSIAIKTPAGTKVYVGEVGTQGGLYMGGTPQIVVPAPWTIPGAQVLKIIPIK